MPGHWLGGQYDRELHGRHRRVFWGKFMNRGSKEGQHWRGFISLWRLSGWGMAAAFRGLVESNEACDIRHSSGPSAIFTCRDCLLPCSRPAMSFRAGRYTWTCFSRSGRCGVDVMEKKEYRAKLGNGQLSLSSASMRLPRAPDLRRRICRWRQLCRYIP